MEEIGLKALSQYTLPVLSNTLIVRHPCIPRRGTVGCGGMEELLARRWFMVREARLCAVGPADGTRALKSWSKGTVTIGRIGVKDVLSCKRRAWRVAWCVSI